MTVEFVQEIFNSDVTTVKSRVGVVVILMTFEWVSSGGWVLVVNSLRCVWILSNHLQLWYDVLVEEYWVSEILLECWHGPELLKQWRFNITSENDWILFVELTEQRNFKIFTE